MLLLFDLDGELADINIGHKENPERGNLQDLLWTLPNKNVSTVRMIRIFRNLNLLKCVLLLAVLSHQNSYNCNYDLESRKSSGGRREGTGRGNGGDRETRRGKDRCMNTKTDTETE